jgi:L-fuconate dehydratase
VRFGSASVRVLDVRFPTSLGSIGSDAVNKDPDYSAAYCILETNAEAGGAWADVHAGARERDLRGGGGVSGAAGGGAKPRVDHGDLCAFSRLLTDDSQFRWLGPEKGVIQIAAAAVINAVWDLYAKVEGKPLWRLLAEMPAEQIVSAVDFRYIDDAITRERGAGDSDAQPERDGGAVEAAGGGGVSAYTTSAGWFGFSDEKVRQLCAARGWRRGGRTSS